MLKKHLTKNTVAVHCLSAVPTGQAGTQTGIRILFTLLRAQNDIWEGLPALGLAGKPIKGF